jgi:hypothetical protein
VTSHELAQKIEIGKSSLRENCFYYRGTDGVSASSAKSRFSSIFIKDDFTHEAARVLSAEQLDRAFTISKTFLTKKKNNDKIRYKNIKTAVCLRRRFLSSICETVF